MQGQAFGCVHLLRTFYLLLLSISTYSEFEHKRNLFSIWISLVLLNIGLSTMRKKSHPRAIILGWWTSSLSTCIGQLISSLPQSVSCIQNFGWSLHEVQYSLLWPDLQRKQWSTRPWYQIWFEVYMPCIDTLKIPWIPHMFRTAKAIIPNSLTIRNLSNNSIVSWFSYQGSGQLEYKNEDFIFPHPYSQKYSFFW